MKVNQIFSKLGGYLIWLVLILLVLSVIRNLSRVAMVSAEIRKQQAIIAKMRAENAELESEVNDAQSQVFIEKQIRDKLGLAREGEAIVILPDADTLRKLAPSQSQEADTLPDPTWKKWLKLFL